MCCPFSTWCSYCFFSSSNCWLKVEDILRGCVVGYCMKFSYKIHATRTSSLIFYSPWSLPEVTSTLKLVFIFAIYDFIIFTCMYVCGHTVCRIILRIWSSFLQLCPLVRKPQLSRSSLCGRGRRGGGAEGTLTFSASSFLLGPFVQLPHTCSHQLCTIRLHFQSLFLPVFSRPQC